MRALSSLGLALLLATAPAHAQDTGRRRSRDAGVDAPRPTEDAHDAHVETVAEFEGHDPFERDPGDDVMGRPIDPMATMADDDPALGTPPTEAELLEAPVRALHGPVLSAIPGVRTQSHRTHLELSHGLLVAEETLVFSSSARHRAEVLYRLGIPPGANVISLRVCNAAGCRDGIAEAHDSPQGAYDEALIVRGGHENPLPVGHVERDHDELGDFLAVRAAPLLRDQTLEITVRWVAEPPIHGGATRITWPNRGTDARDVRRSLEVTAVDVVEPHLDAPELGRVPLDAAPIELAAQAMTLDARTPRTLSSDRIELLAFPCDAGRCVHARALAPRPHIEARPIVIAIDASPSTTIGARGRIADVVRVLLADLPAGAQVRVIAFAARTEWISRTPLGPSAVDLDAVRAASSADLGASTRFEALMQALRDADLFRRGSEVIVIGDGGITSSPNSFEDWVAAREGGVRFYGVNVADRSSTLALTTHVEDTGGFTMDVGPEAASAAEGHGDAALSARLAAIHSSPPRTLALGAGHDGVRLGLLRDGEALTFDGALTSSALRGGTVSVRARDADLALAEALRARADHRTRMVAIDVSDASAPALCTAPDGHPTRRAHLSSALLGPGRALIALAHHRSCAVAAPAAASSETGLPSRPLLMQLRRRVIPLARRCFRDDRRGRADYSTRADIRVTLADREIVDTHIEGPITPALSSCLASAFDGLEIPSFDGTIVVHWPLYTAAEPPPPTLELAPDVSRSVDRVMLAE
jgi:hypothetical protein